MTNIEKIVLMKKQVNSLREKVNRAAQYHYARFKFYERIYLFFEKPKATNFRLRILKFAQIRMKLEYESYIYQITRFKSFLYFFIKEELVEKNDINQKYHIYWDDFTEKYKGGNKSKGPLSYARDKWLAHRSADDPRNDNFDEMMYILEIEHLGIPYPKPEEHKAAIHFPHANLTYYLDDNHDLILAFFEEVFTKIDNRINSMTNNRHVQNLLDKL